MDLPDVDPDVPPVATPHADQEMVSCDSDSDSDDDPMDMLRRIIVNRYGLDAHVVESLVVHGHELVTNVLQQAGRVDVQLDSALHLLPLVTEADITSALPVKENMRTWTLPACGDGSCLLTSLRISLDLLVSTTESLRLLSDPKAVPLGRPELSGERGSPNHSDNLRIRLACVAWYISPLSNLDQLMDDTVQYETLVDNVTTLVTRAMTRADFIVMQMTENKGGDINMSPASRDSRNAMALAYMTNQSQDRVWGSLPLIVAFAHIMKTPRSIRVYQVVQGKLQSIYQDVTPPGASPLPPVDLDDALECLARTPRHDQDDFTAWESGADDTVCPIDTHQNFIRLLYHPGGHYDALATSSQQRIVCAAFPDAKPFFK